MSTAPVQVTYLNLGPIGGRGGTLRFFLLANDIAYEDNLKEMGEEWDTEKKRLMETGENPCGSVPVTYMKSEKGDEDLHLSQHISTMRYLANVNKLSPEDSYHSYIQDLVSDEYFGWRVDWVKHIVSATDEEKETYKTDDVPKQLAKFNSLYEKFASAGPYLSTGTNGKPLWGDSSLFGLIYDHIQTGFITEADLEAYPKLSTMYKEFGAIPDVAKWIDDHKNVKPPL